MKQNKNYNKKFFIINCGCSRRELDAERIRNYFSANNLELVKNPKDADYLFIVSCGLEGNENISIDTINKFKKFDGEIIVGGCLPAMNLKRLKKVFNGKMLSTKELDKIDNFFPDFSIKFQDIPDANKGLSEYINKKNLKIYIYHLLRNKLDISSILEFLYNIIATIGKIRRKIGKPTPFSFETIIKNKIKNKSSIDIRNSLFSLRISKGCLGNCSYCTIKNAIGRLKSKSPSLILDELKRGLSKKCYKLNIQSSDTGSYGLDIGTNLPQLLNNILKEDKRITFEYIQDFHPIWVCRYKKELIELNKAKKIKSMLIAFQSGSERILKLMNRNTNIDEFKEVIKKIKEVNPHLRIRTQVIVGFPTETEQDFQKTLEVIKECEFDQIDIFAYYETDTTPSAKIQPKVPKNIIRDRICRLNNEKKILSKKLNKIII